MSGLFRQNSNSVCAPRDICAVIFTPDEQQALLTTFARLAAACNARLAVVNIAPMPVFPAELQPVVLSLNRTSPGAAQRALPDLLAIVQHNSSDGARDLWLAASALPASEIQAALALGVTVLSLYDARSVSGDALFSALQSHPFILMAGAISENEAYLPPLDPVTDPQARVRFAHFYERMQTRRADRTVALAGDHTMAGLVSDALALVEKFPGQPARVVDAQGALAGYSAIHLVSRPYFRELVHSDDQSDLAAFFQRVLGGDVTEIEFRLRKNNSDGTLEFTWVRLAGRGEPVGHDDGLLIYLAARDIDLRKRDEILLADSYTALGAAVQQVEQTNQLLREKQQQLDLLFNQAPVQIWTTDRQLIFTSLMGTDGQSWSDQPQAEAPPQLPQLIGHSLLDTFPADSPIHQAHAAALQGETLSLQANLAGRVYLARVEPLRDAQAAVVGTIGVALDITEQQRAEEALLLIQGFNRSLLDASDDYLVLLDRHGRILALNDAAASHLGRPVEHLVGSLLVDTFPPDTGQMILNDLSSVITTKKPLEHSLENLGANLRVRMYPIADPQGRVAQAALLVQDISSFVRAEQDERSRREVAEILRSVSDDLTRSTNRQEVLQVVIEGLRWLAPGLSAQVFMIKEGFALLECFFQQPGVRTISDMRQMPPLSVDALTNLRSMYNTQKPVLFKDVWQEPEWVRMPVNRWTRAYAAAPIVVGSSVVGFITLTSPHSGAVNEQHVQVLQALAGQSAVALQKVQMFADLEGKNKALAEAYNELEDKNQALVSAYDATIAGWARALELRDKETEGHSQRVVTLTMRLAERMKIPSEQNTYLRWGALLHDIGKMGIPDHILLKSGQPLTEQEWQVMKQHPTLAYNMLSGIDYLKPALDIPHLHHEWWDGSGYPLGLSGEDIPLSARIFTVVDAWDALTNKRPYRPAWPAERAARHIRSLAGSQFDPQVVDEFLQMLDYETIDYRRTV